MCGYLHYCSHLVLFIFNGLLCVWHSVVITSAKWMTEILVMFSFDVCVSLCIADQLFRLVWIVDNIIEMPNVVYSKFIRHAFRDGPFMTPFPKRGHGQDMWPPKISVGRERYALSWVPVSFRMFWQHQLLHPNNIWWCCELLSLGVADSDDPSTVQATNCRQLIFCIHFCRWLSFFRICWLTECLIFVFIVLLANCCMQLVYTCCHCLTQHCLTAAIMAIAPELLFVIVPVASRWSESCQFLDAKVSHYRMW